MEDTNMVVENDEQASFVLGKEDAALIIRNTKQDTVTIELAIPTIDPVPPYVAVFFAVSEKLHDNEFINGMLDYIGEKISMAQSEMASKTE